MSGSREGLRSEPGKVRIFRSARPCFVPGIGPDLRIAGMGRPVVAVGDKPATPVGIAAVAFSLQSGSRAEVARPGDGDIRDLGCRGR